MKFLMILITVSGLIIGTLLFLLGVLFKIMHYADANLMLYGGLFLIIVSIVIKLKNKKK